MDGRTARRVLEVEEVRGSLEKLSVDSQARLARLHQRRHRCGFRRAGGPRSARVLATHLLDVHRWRFRIARKTSVCTICQDLMGPGEIILLLRGMRNQRDDRYDGWVHVEPCPVCVRGGGRCR